MGDIDFNWEKYFTTLNHMDKGKDNLFYLSLDTEYYQETKYKNVCLSYQVAILNAETSTYKELFFDVKNDERLSLDEIISKSLEICTVSKRERYDVIVIAHNFIAEFCMLKDREKLLPYLTAIRKTLISKSNFLIGKFNIRIYDTILIAPNGYYSLKKLSTILGELNMLKIDIKQYDLENMDNLKSSNFSKFKEYGMQDSRVTLALWLVLQKQYNELIYDIEGKRYNTFETFKTCVDIYGEEQFEELFLLNKDKGKLLKSIESRNTSNFKKETYYRTIGEASVQAFFVFLQTTQTTDTFCDESAEMKQLENILHVKDNKKKIASVKWKKFKELHKENQFSIRSNTAYRNFVAKFPWKLDTGEPFNNNFIRDIYFGGRNESFYVGDTAQDQTIKEEYIYLDIDFVGAYPTAMCCIPQIDWEEGISEVRDNRQVKKWYKQSKSLHPDNLSTIVGFADIEFVFPPEVLYPCLPVKHEKFGLIYPLEGKTLVTATEIILAQEILEMVQRRIQQSAEYQNLLQEYKLALTKSEKKQIKQKLKQRLGYIDVKKSLELLPLKKEESPKLLLKEYFSNKMNKRKAYKDLAKNTTSKIEKNICEINEKILKEFLNTLYGKTAQAINQKTTFNVSKNISEPLKFSSVTTPYVAATTTGLVRAALSSLIFAVETYNESKSKKLVLISATTDGALLGIPTSELNNFLSIQHLEEEMNKTLTIETLKPDFSELLSNFYSLKLLKNMRFNLAKDFYLEIKHVATKIVSVKNRGQIGSLKYEQGGTKITNIAKFGHKPPLSFIYEQEEYKEIMNDNQLRKEADAKWLINEWEKSQKDMSIDTYPVRSLLGIRKIIDDDTPYVDLVGTSTEKRLNFDFDYKRKLEDTSCTKPFKNLKEMLKYRYAVEAIRKRGLVATRKLVEEKIAMKSMQTRMRGNQYDHTLKIFLRAIFQHEHYTKQLVKLKAKDCVILINNLVSEQDYNLKPINENHIKNAKRLYFEANSIPLSTGTRQFLKLLHKAFGLEFEQKEESLLLIKNLKHIKEEQYLSSEIKALKSFLSAVSLGKRKQIPVFKDLKGEDINEIYEAIATHLQKENLFTYTLIQKYINWAKNSEVINLVPNTTGARKIIYELRLAILHYIPRESESNRYLSKPKYKFSTKVFYEVLLERNHVQKVKKNPSKEKCLKMFVLALLHKIEPLNKVEIKYTMKFIDDLYSFGLNKNIYYKLKKEKFIYKSLKNTTENKRQIKQMYSKLSNSKNRGYSGFNSLSLDNIFDILLEI